MAQYQRFEGKKQDACSRINTINMKANSDEMNEQDAVVKTAADGSEETVADSTTQDANADSSEQTDDLTVLQTTAEIVYSN